MRWEFVFSLQKTAKTERFTASEERGTAARLEGPRKSAVADLRSLILPISGKPEIGGACSLFAAMVRDASP